MASFKKSKTEKQSNNGQSSKTASKASKPRKEDLKKKKKEVVEKKNKNKLSSSNVKKDDKTKKKEDVVVVEKKNKNKHSNGNVKKDDKLLIVPSSSAESLEEAQKGHEIDIDGIANGRTSGTKPKKGKRKQQIDGYDAEEKADAKTNKFPMSRIRTIMRAEDPDLRVSEEAILVISKATVKFLEQLTRESCACAVQDRKKLLGYQRLSYVVNKQRRYEFLLDHVPEKLKAEDALRERNSCRDWEELQSMLQVLLSQAIHT